MLFSGIAWDAHGYEVEVLDENGAQARPTARFRPHEVHAMINHLRRNADELVATVESTNGILDGHLMAGGVEVYRADPEVLPQCPVFGSVPANSLALLAQRSLSRLTRLDPSRGTQTGRESDLDAGINASSTEMEYLTEAGRCLPRGHPGRKDVALTFDDGPSPPFTGQILDTLQKYDVPATFFCVGLHAKAFPDDIVRMREEGHGVGNHTWSHPFLPELSRGQLTEQIVRTRECIENVSGGVSPTLFRPPYGSRSPDVVRWLSETDSTVVLWDVEPFDWSMPGASAISSLVVDRVRPGSVILLHDGGGDREQTVAALPAIIEGLHERDFRFVHITELMTINGDTAGPPQPGTVTG